MRYFYWLLLSLLLLPLAEAYSQPYLHLDTAISYLYVREATGNNDGYEVEKFLKHVGLRKGSPWCAAFVSYCLTAAGASEPTVRSGLASRFITGKAIPANRVYMGIEKIEKGMLVVWLRGNTIFGHIGITASSGTYLKRYGMIVIEGNVVGPSRIDLQDSRQGVHIKKRWISPYDYFRITHFTRVVY